MKASLMSDIAKVLFLPPVSDWYVKNVKRTDDPKAGISQTLLLSHTKGPLLQQLLLRLLLLL